MSSCSCVHPPNDPCIAFLLRGWGIHQNAPGREYFLGVTTGSEDNTAHSEFSNMMYYIGVISSSSQFKHST